MNKHYLIICWLLSFFANQPFISQTCISKYGREIIADDNQWQKIEIPNEMYLFLTSSLNDLKVIGIENKDTVTYPYQLYLEKDEYSIQTISFEKINESIKDNKKYYTFLTKENSPISEFKLNFANSNFDWKINLEGSNDNNEWFEISKDYRIVNLNTKDIEFNHTTISFTKSSYQYWRISIDSKNANLTSCELTNKELTQGKIREIKSAISSQLWKNDTKQTIQEIELFEKSQVNHLLVSLEQDYDFYRPYKLEYLIDSTLINNSWVFNYGFLTSGVLTSWGSNKLENFSCITSRLKITINHYDNEPIYISKANVSGYIHSITTRLSNDNYSKFLYYGSDSPCNAPFYDIALFQDKIPTNIPTAKLGNQFNIEIPIASNPSTAPIPKYWLWILMAVIATFLGYFSLKFIQEKKP